jgi:hypothetical protein
MTDYTLHTFQAIAIGWVIGAIYSSFVDRRSATPLGYFCRGIFAIVGLIAAEAVILRLEFWVTRFGMRQSFIGYDAFFEAIFLITPIISFLMARYAFKLLASVLPVRMSPLP